MSLRNRKTSKKLDFPLALAPTTKDRPRSGMSTFLKFFQLVNLMRVMIILAKVRERGLRVAVATVRRIRTVIFVATMDESKGGMSVLLVAYAGTQTSAPATRSIIFGEVLFGGVFADVKGGGPRILSSLTQRYVQKLALTPICLSWAQSARPMAGFMRVALKSRPPPEGRTMVPVPVLTDINSLRPPDPSTAWRMK